MNQQLREQESDAGNQNGCCTPVVESDLSSVSRRSGLTIGRPDSVSQQEGSDTAGAARGVCCSDASSGFDSQATDILLSDSPRGVTAGCGCNPNRESLALHLNSEVVSGVQIGNLTVGNPDGSQRVKDLEGVIQKNQPGSQKEQPAGSDCCGGQAKSGDHVGGVSSQGNLQDEQQRHQINKASKQDIANGSENFRFGHAPILAGTSKIGK